MLGGIVRSTYLCFFQGASVTVDVGFTWFEIACSSVRRPG